MQAQTTRKLIFATLALALTAPGAAGAQGPQPGPVDPAGRAPIALRARPMAVHETSKGVFIDPLITEHAFVDRKVRSDLAVHLLADDEGRVYENALIFEYAFTRWFSLELVQPLLLLDPEDADSEAGIGDLGLGAKFQLTRAADTGGLILSAGMETALPSGEEAVGAGEEYVLTPLAAVDWVIGSGLFKLQSQGELEIAFPREAGDGKVEAFEWNTALSYFASSTVVPILELNAAFEGLEEEETASIYALTPGAVISLRDVAGKSFDIATGAQIFFGSDREEDLALLVSLRHHWQWLGVEGISPAAQ